jgi:hypothetical protein
LEFFQVKYVYDWVKPSLARVAWSFGRGEGLGEENELRMIGLECADAPLPEGEGLGVGVVHAEHADAVPDPEREHIAQRVPKTLRVLRREVDGVDVLVLLRRVFGVADGTIGQLFEPLGVFLHPGVIGRALHGEVEGHFKAGVLGAAHEEVEVGEGAEIRVHFGVAAVTAPDWPRGCRRRPAPG